MANKTGARAAPSPLPAAVAAIIAPSSRALRPLRPQATPGYRGRAAVVEIGGTIGVVLLLLTLGLEFSVDELAASLNRHLPSAVVDFVLNATPARSRAGCSG